MYAAQTVVICERNARYKGNIRLSANAYGRPELSGAIIKQGSVRWRRAISLIVGVYAVFMAPVGLPSCVHETLGERQNVKE